MIPFSVIVAMDEENGIGRAGQLPWHLSADLRHFKEMTTRAPSGKQNVVIMGRKTWESLPQSCRPLPHRFNVVITRDKERKFPEGVLKAISLQEALDILESDSGWRNSVEAVYVIGGGEIYREAVRHPGCKTIYVTKVSGRFHCDTFFPDFREDFKRRTVSDRRIENGIDYYLEEFVRLK